MLRQFIAERVWGDREIKEILSPHTGHWLQLTGIRKVSRKPLYRIEGISPHGRKEVFEVSQDREMTVR